MTIGPSVMGFSATVNAMGTGLGPQRKSFNAQGLTWAFYSNGAYMVYQTTVDGLSWSSVKEVVLCENGHRFSLWFDGLYLHLIRQSNYHRTLYYRRGKPESDRTITWDSESIIARTMGAFHFPGICLDTNGYPYVCYTQYDTNVPYLTKSRTRDGVWNTAPGFPIPLTEQTGSYFKCGIVPLLGGKIYIAYMHEFMAGWGRLWDGSQLRKEEPITDLQMLEDGAYSLLAVGDTVYLAVNGRNYFKQQWDGIYIVKRTDAIFTEELMSLDISTRSYPQLSKDTANNPYCFWATKGKILYRHQEGGVWKPSVEWITGELISGWSLSSYYQMSEGKVGVLYISPASGPGNAIYAALSGGEAPVKYKLTINASAGGTTDPVPGIYPHEEYTSVTIKASPDTGYSFKKWPETGVKEPEILVYMDENLTRTAIFEEVAIPPNEWDDFFDDDKMAELVNMAQDALKAAMLAQATAISLDKLIQDIRDLRGDT